MLEVKFKNSKKLLKVLASMENVIKKNPENSPLKFLRLEKMGDKLCILARNNVMRIGFIVEETEIIQGDYNLYDYKTLISLLNVLEDEIYISNEIIKNKKCKYKISYIEKSEYPEDIIPKLQNNRVVKTEDFKQAIEDVIDATSKKEFERILSGVYINKNTLVGCDGNRIFTKEIETELENVILSKELVNELLKLPFEDEISMAIFGSKVIFEDATILISCNILANNYPNYEKILPMEIKQELIFKKYDLINAINLVMPVINKETNALKLNISDEKIKVSINNGTNEAETEFVIPDKFEPTEVKFNANYLIDMLKANNETIKLKQYKGEYTGYGFESGKAKQFIMPIIN